MAHTRKKGGVRKDHKVERMREDIVLRHDMHVEKVTTDQHDVQTYKPGGPSDHNREPRPNQPQKR